MKPNLRPLAQQVIVITGASSGIGLATARAAVAKGARLVLVARNEEALEQIAGELGGSDQVVTLAADVGDRQAMQQVADLAIEKFGRFDTWVNNAGIAVIGKIEDASDADHRRLFETNFWGTYYGSTMAAKYLREHGGAIINLGSSESAAPIPVHGMYAASKHAVKAMTDVLRVELRKDAAPVSVTLIRPAATDTLFTDHAKDYTDSAPVLPPPLYAPEEVAEAILYAAVHSTRDMYIGASKAFTVIAQNFPRFYDWFSEKVIYDRLQNGLPDANRQGALHGPNGGGLTARARGYYPGRVLRHSLYTQASMHPVATVAMLGLGAVAIGALLCGRGRGR